jgi:hypothetical protein
LLRIRICPRIRRRSMAGCVDLNWEFGIGGIPTSLAWRLRPPPHIPNFHNYPRLSEVSICCFRTELRWSQPGEQAICHCPLSHAEITVKNNNVLLFRLSAFYKSVLFKIQGRLVNQERAYFKCFFNINISYKYKSFIKRHVKKNLVKTVDTWPSKPRRGTQSCIWFKDKRTC